MASSTSSSTESTKLEISVMYFGSEPYNISLESTGRGHENRVGVSGMKITDVLHNLNYQAVIYVQRQVPVYSTHGTPHAVHHTQYTTHSTPHTVHHVVTQTSRLRRGCWPRINSPFLTIGCLKFSLRAKNWDSLGLTTQYCTSGFTHQIGFYLPKSCHVHVHTVVCVGGVGGTMRSVQGYHCVWCRCTPLDRTLRGSRGHC